MRALGIFVLAFIALLLLASALGMVGSLELAIIVLLSLAAAGLIAGATGIVGR